MTGYTEEELDKIFHGKSVLFYRRFTLFSPAICLFRLYWLYAREFPGRIKPERTDRL